MLAVSAPAGIARATGAVALDMYESLRARKWLTAQCRWQRAPVPMSRVAIYQ